MNLLQASIAHKVAAHFRRERCLMPRSYPVDLFDNDQGIFVNDLIELFSKNNVNFDADCFRILCFKKN